MALPWEMPLRGSNGSDEENPSMSVRGGFQGMTTTEGLDLSAKAVSQCPNERENQKQKTKRKRNGGSLGTISGSHLISAWLRETSSSRERKSRVAATSSAKLSPRRHLGRTQGCRGALTRKFGSLSAPTQRRDAHYKGETERTSLSRKHAHGQNRKRNKQKRSEER